VVSIFAARKNDKVLRRQFVYLLLLNIYHPFTRIAALCMCSPWGPQWCQFRYPCGELSPLFWQKTVMNMLLKAQWKCTILKPMIKIYFLFIWNFPKIRVSFACDFILMGLVVRAAGCHAGNLGSILGRDGLYTLDVYPSALSLLWRRYCTI
jgi:hypothetical protein